MFLLAQLTQQYLGFLGQGQGSIDIARVESGPGLFEKLPDLCSSLGLVVAQLAGDPVQAFFSGTDGVFRLRSLIPRCCAGKLSDGTYRRAVRSSS